MTTFCVVCSVHVEGQDRQDQQEDPTLDHHPDQHTNPIQPKPVQGTPGTRGAANIRNQSTHRAHVNRSTSSARLPSWGRVLQSLGLVLSKLLPALLVLLQELLSVPQSW